MDLGLGTDLTGDFLRILSEIEALYSMEDDENV
jgi:hypothetical protein